jgi:MoxR-like ATPase
MMMDQPGTAARVERVPASIDQLQQALAAQHYIADRSIAVSAFLALKLGRPLFLEGEAGVGKTEVAKALAAALGAELIRLQCYEGLDVGHAVYEWDYARQLLEIRLLEAAHALGRETDSDATEEVVAPARAHLFSETFLIKRPLLRALESAGQRPTVLLIDEIDRADEEFEGYLLELLSDFQVTIPELGTIRARTPPIVILTSNRTREVHDALKRRCLYLWIGYPDFDKELRIIESRLPEASKQLAEQVAAFVQELRLVELYKVPGVSETLDWAAALVALDQERLDPAAIDETIGLLLKYQEDVQAVRGARAGELLSRALARGTRQSGTRIPADSRGSGSGG